MSEREASDHPGGLASTGPVTEPCAGANIWSGGQGLLGALTNMSERAYEKGCIKNRYPVRVSGIEFLDAEAAYQAMKVPGCEPYNDDLMVDIIALKLRQHPALQRAIEARGGEAWLSRCSHVTGARSERGQSWEGEGEQSRFIRNLIQAYSKAATGRARKTRVVHVHEAPFDVYIGRPMRGPGVWADHDEGAESAASNSLSVGRSAALSAILREGSPWQNPLKVGPDGSRTQVVMRYAKELEANQPLRQRLPELKGLTLGCWCKSRKNLFTLCHGDVLAAAADGRSWRPGHSPAWLHDQSSAQAGGSSSSTGPHGPAQASLF